jgi:uncharacterized alpha-E superfamily protein
VLRRIANHLFWMARNLERAEWRARLVDVNYHLLIETPPRGTSPWDPMLAIFGERTLFAEHYATADEASVLKFMTIDADNPSSIRGCINLARENARYVRHHISSELWLDINTLYLNAADWTPELFESPGVFMFFADLKDWFYRIAGVLQSTIPRDLSYDFIWLGIMLERAEDVSRMLDVKYHFLLPRLEDVGGPLDMQQWAAVLRSASGLEAYRKRHGNLIRLDHIIDILLFDSTFPRSAKFALDEVAGALERIGQGAACELKHGAPALGELRAELSKRTPKEVIKQGLHEFLLKVQDSCTEIYAQLVEQYLTVD